MVRFALGHILILLCIFAWNLAVKPGLRTLPPERLTALLIVLCIIPTVAAVGAAMLVHAIKPRRIFEGPARHGGKPLAMGAVTAVTATLISSGTLLLIGDRIELSVVYDAVTTALSSGLAAWILVSIFSRKRQPGKCLHCGYDIRGSLEFGRCPECGTAF